MYGAFEPKISFSTDESGRTTTIQEPPFETEARTLGDALRVFDETFDTRTEKYDGSDPETPFVDGVPKYFYHSVVFRGRRDKLLVDIHIYRRDLKICPKQDLDFVLEDGDLINIGQLIC
jgi:hypothetical protein